MRPNVYCHYLAMLLLVPCGVQASLNCERSIAQIVSAQGTVDSQHSEGDWLTVHPQDEFCAGDKIRTAKNSRATLRMRNESVISLEQATTMILPEPTSDAPEWLVTLLSGSGFFRSRKPQQLRIHTQFVNIVHEGTEFLVSVDDQQAQVTVFDGQVRADNAKGSIVIKPGYVGVTPQGHAPHLQALQIRPEDAVQWALYYPPLIDFTKLTALPGSSPLLQQQVKNQLLQALDSVPLALQDNEQLGIKASLLLNVGRVAEAQAQIAQMLKNNPKDSDAVALQAIIAVSKNHQDEALALAQQAVALKPKSSNAKIALSYAYQSLFKLDEALRATQEAIQSEPDNALAFARLAELQLSLGNADEALQAAQTASRTNPTLARTQTVLGFAYLAQVDTLAARRAFDQAIAIDPSDPLAWLGSALTGIRTGKLAEGIQKLETAANLDPNNAVIRSYLGKAHFEDRNFKSVIDHYLDPAHADDGNFEYAATEFKIAKASDSKDPTPWFYDAILKQATNRPVAALHDMQQAKDLNGNRAVYRSRLLLDKDAAVRGTGLGRIYNDLGFNDVANRQAIKSLAIDPGNYSAQRLLADSSANQPRQEVTRASALLQSQLLQSVSLNPIQPRLAYTDLNIPKSVGPAEVGFNEYNKVFERDNYRITNTTSYGSNNLLGNEAVLSGIVNKLSYSLGQLHYQNDGYRANNDIKHDLYNAFVQYEFSPKFNMQAEYRRRDSLNGDLQQIGDMSAFNPNYRRSIGQDTYRLGSTFSPTQHSKWLTSFIYANRDEFVQNFSYLSSSAQNRGYQLESAYLFQHERFNLIIGGGRYFYDIQTQLNSSNLFICLTLSCQLLNNNDTQNFGYAYSNIRLLDNLTATTGLSYDNYSDTQVNNLSIERANPKFGLLWQFNKELLFRLAVFDTLKSPIIVNQQLQPMQIAGFNQFFDDANGVKATQYAIGMDYHPAQNWYTGIELYTRDITFPYIQANTFLSEPRTENLYRFYINWIIHENWIMNSGFRYEDFHATGVASPKAVATAYLPTSVRFFHAIGLFAELRGTYVNQRVNTLQLGEQSFSTDFYLVDAAVGYRLPKQYGIFSLEANNLLDNRFKFRDRAFQTNEIRTSDITPEQTFMARFTFNF
ncbi:MAG: tetratricopeptide repeat protein [Methylovulum sp.]|nr:tetratricopeptide repeat protein [Methylovulum sp.]